MTRAEATRLHPFAQLLVEALERVAAAHVRRRVLQLALEEARIAAVPDKIEDLTFFVSGPLYEHAQRLLGSDFADSLLVELAPVLDRAWATDRAALDAPARPATPVPESEVRTRSRSAIRKLDGAADTEPAPAPATDDAAAPPSKRVTMPYLDAVLATPPGAEPATRVLVVHADDAARSAIAGALEDAAYAVVTAPDTRVARLLLSRLTPALIVADIETLAPDFEPLRPALDEMIGNGRALPVVLLSDERRPDTPDAVRAIVSRTSSRDELLEVVNQLRSALTR
jgi:CheY-like chemotaxis protein